MEKLKKFFDKTFLKFVLVGVVNTLFGTAIMFVFYNVFHLSYWLSSASNYVFGSILSYFLNKYFTFQSKGSNGKTIGRFVVNITNKSDKDLTFYAPSGKTNVNGTMKDPWFSAHLMPGTNATEEFTFSSGELDSLDDLVNTTIGIDAYLTDSYEDVASYTATIA